MSRSARLLPAMLGLVVSLLGAQGAFAADPTLYVRYAMNCTFTITGDNGAPISVIPPGRYQVQVTSPQGFAEPNLAGEADPNVACGGALSFRLTGPGVTLHTTLEDGDSSFDQLLATFQVGTYLAVEDRRPTVARVSITVANSAASTGGGTSTTTTSSSGTKPSVKAVAVAGTLNGGVDTAGKLTLTLKGKKVTSLKPGRYKITVLDETSKRGFTIQRVGKTAVNVTGTTFVGRKSVTLALSAGRWVYYSPSGKTTSFVVG